MPKIILFLAVLLSITGFNREEIRVAEDGVIPDSSLVDAYTYRDECIEPKVNLIKDQYNIKGEAKLVAMFACQEEMFILYSKRTYRVTSTNFIGHTKLLHVDNTIEGVNEFLRIH